MSFNLTIFLFFQKQLKEGIQLRSNTFQLIRAAFDEEVGVEEVESFRRNLQALRYPESLFHFFAFRGGHQYFLQENRKRKEKPKYGTIGKMASKTLKNVSRAAGIKTKKRTLFPELHTHQEENETENNENTNKASALAAIVSSNSSTSTSKTLERMMERSYYKDWIRLGLIPPDYNLTDRTKGQTYATSGSGQQDSFRVTTVNHRYAVANTYPALLLVPARFVSMHKISVKLISRRKKNLIPNNFCEIIFTQKILLHVLHFSELLMKT